MNNQIKRVAVFNDICGYGRCSLNVSMPIISSAGIEVCPIPSAVFSTHTAIKYYELLDTTVILDDYIKSWDKQKINFDGIYTGYLTNKEQIYNALQLFTQYKGSMKFVDPVMGDNGKAYGVQDADLCKHMKKLISKADLITPNYTEACMLTNHKYSDNPNNKELDEVSDKLIKLGAKNIVITGVLQNNKVKNYVYSDKEKFVVEKEHTGDQIHGAGDLFSSCIVAFMIKGKKFRDSIELAANFVCDAVKLTKLQEGFEQRGISFEPLLQNINDLLA